jgi:hypothetical protein
VAIAILIVAAAWMFATHQAKTGGSPNLPLRHLIAKKPNDQLHSARLRSLSWMRQYLRLVS